MVVIEGATSVRHVSRHPDFHTLSVFVESGSTGTPLGTKTGWYLDQGQTAVDELIIERRRAGQEETIASGKQLASKQYNPMAW